MLNVIMLIVVKLNVVAPLNSTDLKARLHYGDNRDKLVGFVEQKKQFCIIKTS